MLSCADKVLQPGLDDGWGLGDLGPVQLEPLPLELELEINPPAALVLVEPDDGAARANLKHNMKGGKQNLGLTELLSYLK